MPSTAGSVPAASRQSISNTSPLNSNTSSSTWNVTCTTISSAVTLSVPFAHDRTMSPESETWLSVWLLTLTLPAMPLLTYTTSASTMARCAAVSSGTELFSTKTVVPNTGCTDSASTKASPTATSMTDESWRTLFVRLTELWLTSTTSVGGAASNSCTTMESFKM